MTVTTQLEALNQRTGEIGLLRAIGATQRAILLLFLGVTMPTVLYLIWGIMEIIQIPLAAP